MATTTDSATDFGLFGPGSVAWGGGYLWVSEFKFSTRLLRFTPQPERR